MNKNQYDIICARRTAFDNMIWQTPALAATLQGFLLANSIDPDTPYKNAFVLSGFSVIIGLATIQLMAKHRYNELRDSHLLAEFEGQKASEGFSVLHGANAEASDVSKNFLTRFSSVRIWISMLVLFSMLSLFGIYDAYEKYMSQSNSTQSVLKESLRGSTNNVAYTFMT